MLDSPPGMTRPHLVELLGLFHENDFRAEFFEAPVGVEIALQCQDSNFHKLQSTAESFGRSSYASLAMLERTSDKRPTTFSDLPTPGLQHVGFVEPCDGQALHRSDQVFADFK